MPISGDIHILYAILKDLAQCLDRTLNNFFWKIIILQTKYCRCLSDCVLHCHDLLWCPYLLPGGCHGAVPGLWRHDSGVSTLPYSERYSCLISQSV